jgi:serine phosphatase RsbU (regulator of sigma subunit)
VEALAESERRLAFLASTSPSLLRSMDYGTVFQRVADLFVPELADACTVRELGADGSVRRVAARHTDAVDRRALDRLDASADPAASPIIHGHLEAGRSLLLRGVDDSSSSGEDGHPRLESAMIVPLVSGDALVGALSLMTVEGGRRYSEADVALVDEVARRAALAVQNAKLFAERSTVAATLQRALLPPALPEIPGVEVAARYHAAASEIGGDFYDVVALDRGRSLIVLGDVCGKGIEAASLTAMVRYTLRAFAGDAAGPSHLLARLNDALLSQLSPERFCTVALALLDPGGDATRVTISLGGHPRPLLVRATGDVGPVGKPGTLLGALPVPELGDEDVLLSPGDALVLFTDGCLAEPSGASGASGVPAEAALAAAVREVAGQGAVRLVEAVEQAAAAAAHSDDVTVLALRRVRE